MKEQAVDEMRQKLMRLTAGGGQATRRLVSLGLRVSGQNVREDRILGLVAFGLVEGTLGFEDSLDLDEAALEKDETWALLSQFLAEDILVMPEAEFAHAVLAQRMKKLGLGSLKNPLVAWESESGSRLMPWEGQDEKKALMDRVFHQSLELLRLFKSDSESPSDESSGEGFSEAVS